MLQSETFLGLTYQCSVVASPWAEVYFINKYDLIRNTSKAILHKLFIDYKTRLSDERLIQRLRQKKRWTEYKRDLLDEIRSRKTQGHGAFDRSEQARRTSASTLSRGEYRRVGRGEKLWDKRAQTPPKPAYCSHEAINSQEHIFRVHCTKTPERLGKLSLDNTRQS